MPNKLLGWNVQIMSGNPMESVIVNEIINEVKKMEVMRQGILTSKKSIGNRGIKVYDIYGKEVRGSNEKDRSSSTLFLSILSNSQDQRCL